MAPAPAAGQSVDSLWGLRQAREWTEARRRPLLVALGVGNVVAQGVLHGAFYARGEWFDVHAAAEILGAVQFATIYVGGLDPLEAIGATMAGQVAFQCAINVAVGRACLDPAEERAYAVGSMDWTFKRIFVGRGRLLELGLGLALIFYREIWRLIF